MFTKALRTDRITNGRTLPFIEMHLKRRRVRGRKWERLKLVNTLSKTVMEVSIAWCLVQYSALHSRTISEYHSQPVYRLLSTCGWGLYLVLNEARILGN